MKFANNGKGVGRQIQWRLKNESSREGESLFAPLIHTVEEGVAIFTELQ